MKEGRRTMAKIAIIISLMAVFFVPASGHSVILQQPHVTENGLQCSDCHWTSGASQPPWENVTIPPGREQDYTLNNKICYRCHAPGNPSGNPAGETHSSQTTSTSKWGGKWTTECIDCHSGHQQRQFNRWRLTDPSNLFLVTGPFTVTGVGPYD